MTCEEIITRADKLRNNAYPMELKLAWINDLEKRIQTEVFLHSPEELTIHESPDEALYGHPAFLDLYEAFLLAKLDLARGEYRNYMNSRTVFEDALKSYMKWYAETQRPAQTRR